MYHVCVYVMLTVDSWREGRYDLFNNDVEYNYIAYFVTACHFQLQYNVKAQCSIDKRKIRYIFRMNDLDLLWYHVLNPDVR